MHADSVKPVALDETPETLWGTDKTDPAEAFKTHGFLMRRVVLTRPPRHVKANGGGAAATNAAPPAPITLTSAVMASARA